MAEETQMSKEDTERLNKFSEKIINGYRVLASLATALENEGVELLACVLAVGAYQKEDRRVVVVGNPSMPPELLKMLLEDVGKEADKAVEQSKIINILGADSIQEERADACESCPDREECESRVRKDTVH